MIASGNRRSTCRIELVVGITLVAVLSGCASPTGKLRVSGLPIVFEPGVLAPGRSLWNWAYEYEGPPAELKVSCRALNRGAGGTDQADMQVALRQIEWGHGGVHQDGYIAVSYDSRAGRAGEAVHAAVQCDDQWRTIAVAAPTAFVGAINENAGGNMACPGQLEILRVGYADVGLPNDRPPGTEGCSLVLVVTVSVED